MGAAGMMRRKEDEGEGSGGGGGESKGGERKEEEKEKEKGGEKKRKKLVGRSISRLVGWSIGWLVGWLIGRLSGWLIVRLVDSPTGFRVSILDHCREGVYFFVVAVEVCDFSVASNEAQLKYPNLLRGPLSGSYYKMMSFVCGLKCC
jgi:hypothetical protein